MTVLRVLTSPDGKHRVLIVDRGGGRYEYEEEYFSEDADERCWVPRRSAT